MSAFGSPVRASAPVVSIPDAEPTAAASTGLLEPYTRPVELASWPNVWRERWGRLANVLEDEGVGWQEAERRAFEQTRCEMVEWGVVEE